MDKKGVTLIELSVAMILLAIVAVVSTQSLAQYYKLGKRPTAKVVNVNLAREKMEELYMSTDWIVGSDSNNKRSWTPTPRLTYTLIDVTQQQ